jgi:hypothetical protein
MRIGSKRGLTMRTAAHDERLQPCERGMMTASNMYRSKRISVLAKQAV